MTDDDDVSEADLDVEELTLDDLGTEDDDGGRGKGRGRSGGLRAGGLGPEGSRYSPPRGPRKATWKPLAAAVLLMASGFLGIYVVGFQLTIESSVEGEAFDLYGQALDLDEARDDNEVPVPDLEVRIEGIDRVTHTDAQGKFDFPGIPGGKYTITFTKRAWDEAVNTRYVTYIFSDFESGQRLSFYVEVKDLDTKFSVPESDLDPAIEALLYYWRSDDTALIRVVASSFDRDLGDYILALSEDGHVYQTYDEHLCGEGAIEFTFSGAGQSTIHAKLLDPDRHEYIGETTLTLPAHPLGTGGWKGTAFPDVALFVENGTVTSGQEDVTVVVHSNDAVSYTYRVDGGAWEPWAPLADGGAEQVWTPSVSAGAHTLDFMAQNSTGANGTVFSVAVTVDNVPPTLDPVRTNGDAVTGMATFDLQTEGAETFRYRLPDGNWSAWRLVVDEVLVPIDDSGASATVEFEVADAAWNRASATGTVNVLHLDRTVTDEYANYRSSLTFCLPVMVIGTVLAFMGGYMAFKRTRPTLAMIGCIGALLATGFGLVGAVLAFLALALIMLSREEFELPGPPPEE